MINDLLPWLGIMAGFLGLLWSADRFIEGSAAIAENLGVSKFIIGLTIVAFGTSAPEVVVSLSSAFNKAGDLAVGNALGSNLANIGMVMGITALLFPLPFKRALLSQEFPIMLAIMAVAGWLLSDGQLKFWEGMALISLLIPLIIWLAKFKKSHLDEDIEDLPHYPMPKATMWFVIGLVLLVVSAEILVWGAKEVALDFGVSPLIIGLTVVAVGTSLPELAASITGARQGHHDLAIGNIIGSNIFNLLLVMGLAPVAETVSMEKEVFSRDFVFMAAISLFLAVAMIACVLMKKDGKKPTISRPIGLILLLLYAGYYYLLFA